jgi:DNA-binding MarR family transcriptional regulator
MKRASKSSERFGTEADTLSILRHWREAVPDDRLAHLVKDAARALLRALQMQLAAHGVSIGHWTFLRILWEKDGLTQRELSEQAGLMEPTTFSAIQAMQRLGYVTRRHQNNNRKKLYVFLTPKGRALKARLVPLAEDVNRIAARAIAQDDIAVTRRVLLAVIENLAREEAKKRQADYAPAARRPPTTQRTPRRRAHPR